jgi:pimeloyl-ACP methyl ester carboxylesterase
VPFASANGIRLFYERAGNGPTTLFLNGSGATLATTRPLVHALAARVEVVAHDQRGLGRSAVPPGPYTMADYAADALALADAVGWGTFRLVGMSFGGMVAQEVAATAPHRVERLALLCTSPGGVGGSSYPLHELADLDPGTRAETFRRLLDTRFSDSWLEAHPSDRALVDVIAGRTTGRTTAAARRGEAEQLQARRHHDVWDRLTRVDCPTLVAAGCFDGIAPLANSRAIADRVSDATLRVYDGGHAFLVQDRRALPEILDFLTG